MSGHPSTHSGFLETDTEETGSMQDSASAGGYSPPAWRRLENGGRSPGFWRTSDNILGSPTLTPARSDYEQQQQQQRQQQQQQQQHRLFLVPSPSTPQKYYTPPQQKMLQTWEMNGRFASSGSSPEFDSDDGDVVDDILGLDDDVFNLHGARGSVYSNSNSNNGDIDEGLERALRTRLPASMSPEKGRSPEPEPVLPAVTSRVESPRLEAIQEEKTVVEDQGMSENFIRFAVRAEIQHRTELIEAGFALVRDKIRAVSQSWTTIFVSVLVALLSFCVLRALSHMAGQRPVPDLVKVAGVARSFEPLIYYSENAVVQVRELEATSMAVWDLGESVRYSNLAPAPYIAQELDTLSDNLKELAMELIKFFANIDGDIDA